MGTNYYHEIVKHNYCCKYAGRETSEGSRAVKCEHCGATERTHVGKSSGGWCFSLHVYPENGINDLADWSRVAETGTFVNEYGLTIPWAELHDVITNRSWEGGPLEDKWWVNNHAMRGPNGLARHIIDGEHVIGHGSGTWDYIVGEFS